MENTTYPHYRKSGYAIEYHFKVINENTCIMVTLCTFTGSSISQEIGTNAINIGINGSESDKETFESAFNEALNQLKTLAL